MDTKVEVKQDLRALNGVFDELTETVPVDELPVFRQFVSNVTATMAAIHARWSEPGNVREWAPEAAETGVAPSLANDFSALQRQMAQISRSLEQLWLDADL